MFVEQNSQIVSIQIFSMKFIGFIGDFLSQFGSQREAESHEWLQRTGQIDRY